MRLKGCRSCGCFAAIFLAVSTAQAGSAREFDYQKDQEFVGGFTRVFHVYGKFLQ
jgi:hypothetical protein